MSNNSLIPSSDELKAIELIVKNAVDSKYFDKVGGLAGAFSIAMYAREMGLPIMNCLFGGIRPVLGKIEIAPQLMNAMIRKSGHILQTKQHTHELCTIYGKRRDTGEEMTVTFTIEDAKRAKIFKPGGAWETYPKNMTYKSALANLARWLFADIISMAYVEGEIQEDEESNQIVGLPAIDASEPSEAEISATFKEKFKSIENMDFDLNDFVEFTAKKSGKSTFETLKQAVKNHERFAKAYLKWVEEKKPLEEISIVEEGKGVVAQQLNLV